MFFPVELNRTTMIMLHGNDFSNLNLRRQKLGDFVTRLYEAKDFESAFSALEKFVAQLGFEGALYTYIPRLSLDNNLPIAPVYCVTESYSPAYLKHYEQARFDQVDPIVASISKGALTSLDWWVEVEKGKMDQAGKEVIVTAREEYEIINGITLPTLSNFHGISGASYISSEQDRLYKKLKRENLESLELATRIFHDTVMANAFHLSPFIQPLIGNLSPKERALLRGLAEGKTIPRIADELGTTTDYLNKLLRHTRQKMSGALFNDYCKINRDQLMHYVGLYRLLDYL